MSETCSNNQKIILDRLTMHICTFISSVKTIFESLIKVLGAEILGAEIHGVELLSRPVIQANNFYGQTRLNMLFTPTLPAMAT